MKVALTHIGGSPDTPFLRELLAEPPVEYVNIAQYKNSEMKIKNVGKGFDSFLMKVQGIIGFPSAMPVFLKVDLVHAAHHLVLNKRAWVVDFEHVGSLAGYESHNKWLAKKLTTKLLLHPECKKLMAWSYGAARSLMSYVALNEKDAQVLENKLVVLYPAMRSHQRVNQFSEQINILFVSRYWEHKGGNEALQTMMRLAEKYSHVRCTMITEVPKNITLFNGKNQIVIKGLMPREELEKIWAQTNILLYPSWGDTFGFPILEALSYGIPVVCLDDFVAHELVQNDVTGFVVRGYSQKWYDVESGLWAHKNNDWKASMIPEREQVVQRLCAVMCFLIESASLRDAMGLNAWNEVYAGKFSIGVRNHHLQQIYEECK